MSDGTVGYRRSDFYNDPEFNYAQFWVERDYEHQAEVIALRRLLRGQRFGHAIDIGGGYGRLSVILGEYADRVTLTDPSTQQLDLSARFFPHVSRFDRVLTDASHLHFADQSVDLVALIRVLHHLPRPEPEFAEFSRVLRPGGFAVIEVANSMHVKRRVSGLMTGQRGSDDPVDTRSEESRRRGAAPYFNHHPRTIARQLDAVGLRVRRVLSVSNLRHPVVKALLPRHAMLSIERAAQRPLGRLYFGPSVFFLLQKTVKAASARPSLTDLRAPSSG